MNYHIKSFTSKINGSVNLPTSKSITNRLLIIRALCKNHFNIHNISESEDSEVMLKAFNNFKNNSTVDIGPAGTAMRFMTAFLSIQQGNFILTGSERMQNRPIAKLVDALRSIGSDISYTDKNGFPPLKINGKKLEGGKISIDGSISSQYISALLMIAPILTKGLEIELTGNIISSSYIKMTLDLMNYFGIQYEWNSTIIKIPAQEYIAKDITVEPDWSAASYWYETIALIEDKNSTIELRGLKINSLQGDAKIAELFDKIGVQTKSNSQGDGIILSKKEITLSEFNSDFIDNPDMVQTFAVTLCLLGIPFNFTGTQSLKIKETDRITALQNELKKLGFIIYSNKPEEIYWKGETCQKQEKPIFINTYKDHRMAMAFTPAVFKNNYELIIEEPEVVGKSYPNFWIDFTTQIGLKLKEEK